ncbi:MAG: T9SS type A sorting domain-containing protein [Bacteroidota bacterium]
MPASSKTPTPVTTPDTQSSDLRLELDILLAETDGVQHDPTKRPAPSPQATASRIAPVVAWLVLFGLGATSLLAQSSLPDDLPAPILERLNRVAGKTTATLPFNTADIAINEAGPGNAVVTVNTLVYERDGSCSDGDCSIVDALDVVAAAGGGVVQFQAIASGSPSTITFDPTIGTPNISGNGAITIDATAVAEGITFSGNNAIPLLRLTGGVQFTADKVHFTEGHNPDTETIGGGGAVIAVGATVTLRNGSVTQSTALDSGGGIDAVDSSITLDNMMVSGNTTDGGLGGGLSFFSVSPTHALSIIGSTIKDNVSNVSNSAAVGGGVGALIHGPLTIQNSTVENNRTVGGGIANQGGGLWLILQGGTASIAGSVVTKNTGINGGGLYLQGSETPLVIDQSTLSENFGGGAGGAIYSHIGVVRITDSRIADNRTTQAGGGIFNLGDMALVSTTVTGNEAAPVIDGTHLQGGGIFHRDGTLTLTNSTLTNNSVSITLTSGVSSAPNPQGGGLYLGGTGTATLTNSTLFENRAFIFLFGSSIVGEGGMIYAEDSSTLTIAHSTLARNATTSGANLDFNGSTLSLLNTVMSNTSSTECRVGTGSSIVQNSYMWVQDGTCNTLDGGTPTSFQSGDPFLGSALADNGGTTQTVLPQPGSPLIDAGHCPGIATDQRGFGRPVDDGSATDVSDGCDIGAVEAGAGPIVSNTNDSGPGSLRHLIENTANGGTINFAPTLNGLTIALTGAPLRINADLTLDGSTLPSGITVSRGSGTGRILDVEADRTVTIKRLALTGGTDGTIAGIVSNLGTLALEEVTVSGGAAPVAAGVFNSGTGHLTLRRSLITGNAASNGAGGVLNSGTLVVESSTIHGNSAPNGGGGVFNSGTATLARSTVYGNGSATTGGANIANSNDGGPGELHLISTAVGGALAGPDCANTGTIATMSRTLIEDGTCAPTLSGNPMLSALASNGGPTQTLIPQAGSPLIDAGSCNGQTVDQRGEARPVDATSIANADDGCDIGAAELQDVSALPVELTHFEALRDGAAIVLSWQTASETNNAGFEVQQAATDAKWQVATFVSGAGTTLEAQAYAHRVEDLPSGTHRFRLKQVDYDGAFEYSREVEVTIEVPRELHLEAAYPNPFNPSTVIGFTVPRRGEARLVVYDALGREVLRLFEGIAEAGQRQAVRLNGAGLASGTYLYRLSFGGEVRTGRVLLVK